MSAKVIDKSVLGDEFDRVSKLAASIKTHHTEIAAAQEQIDTEKKDIVGTSKGIFFGDLENGEEAPVVVGNHEYHTEDGIVRVNFKVMGRPMTDINKKPADEVLKTQVGEEAYQKLFQETKTHTPGATTQKMFQQAQGHPELFTIRLTELGVDQQAQLVQEHPDWLVISIKDPDKYAETYPDCTVSTTTVKVKGNFLDKVAALDGALRTKLRKFLVSFLKPTLNPVVVCGNASKTS